MALPTKPYLANLATPINEPTGTVTLGANTDFILLDVNKVDVVALEIQGTFTATLVWTSSIDNVNFFSLLPYNTLGGLAASSTGTSNQQLFFNLQAMNVLKLQITAYTSGTINLTWNAVDENSSALVNIGQVTPGISAASLGKAEDAASVSGDTGVFVLSVRNDTSTSPANAEGDYQQISTNQYGHVLVKAAPTASIAQAASQHRVVSAASTNATSVKASNANIYHLIISNTNAALRYVKFFNKASAPTVGTDTPVLVIAIPPSNTIELDFTLMPFPFTVGLAYDMVTGATDADATAVAAADIHMTILYA